jgi:hypothetical protein
MDLIKSYSIRLFVWITFFMTVLFIMVNCVFYTTLNTLSLNISAAPGAGSAVLPGLKALVKVGFPENFVLISACVFTLFGFTFWLLLRASFVKLIQRAKGFDIQKPNGAGEEKSPVKKDKPSKDRRMFLHLLSAFQREGRLVDFFAEDLSLYEDAQIGAAVRSIHENCKKTVEKYISPKPVIDKDEGDTITVHPDFDPDSIKLTGNVTGDPPFKGIVRHKGWQASKPDIPTLSGSKESKIIAPAEVEIE